MPRGKLIDRSGSTKAAATSEVIALRFERRYFFFQNLSDTTMWLNFGADATEGAGSIRVEPDTQPLFFEGEFIPAQDVRLICSAQDKAYTCKEG